MIAVFKIVLFDPKFVKNVLLEEMSFKLFDVSAFEVTPMLPVEVPSVAPRGEPPQRRHIMILDRGYFGFLEELSLILKPLKSCLLLASHVDKHEVVKGGLPSIAIAVKSVYL